MSGRCRNKNTNPATRYLQIQKPKDDITNGNHFFVPKSRRIVQNVGESHHTLQLEKGNLCQVVVTTFVVKVVVCMSTAQGSSCPSKPGDGLQVNTCRQCGIIFKDIMFLACF